MKVTKNDLKPFQIQAISELGIEFSKLWKGGLYRVPLVFKAPTGSGKTIMMADFVKSFDDEYNFEEDKCYIWISFGDSTSCNQSLNKFAKYFDSDFHYLLKPKEYIGDGKGKLNSNEILFINWSSLVISNPEGRELRKEDENLPNGNGKFDNFIINTKLERDIILIVDEAHTEADTVLANDIIDLINPRIIIKVTATPNAIPSASDIKRKKAGFVEVYEEDVIESGLIKKKIVIQTEDDINEIKNENTTLSTDQILLRLAVNKRNELCKLIEKSEEKYNPLVMIQLPNDYKESKGDETDIKKFVLSELASIGVNIDTEVAIWLSKEKTLDKLENITNNLDGVNYLIFKMAPATGWDCPRASILVMYREIKSPTFKTQIIGRIKRMPFGKHFEKNDELNSAYIYTNYSRNDIRDIRESDSPNKPPVYSTKIKDGIDTIFLEGITKKRTGYNTITPPTKWQTNFIHQANMFFNINEGTNAIEEVLKLDLDINKKVVFNNVISDAEIDSFDNFIEEIKERSKEISMPLSDYDVEKLFGLLCYKVLNEQHDENAKYNASRSWRTVKSSIAVWFNKVLKIERSDCYAIAVNDLLKDNSVLAKVLYNTLVSFRTVQPKKTIFTFLPNKVQIPTSFNSYTDDYEEVKNINKYVHNKFFILKDYSGKKNEMEFIEFLENQEIDWWFKQDDDGISVFGIRYVHNNEEHIFNPDFIIKKDNKIYILDTKSGFTLNSTETKAKARDLQAWITSVKDQYAFEIIGGIVVKKDRWKININQEFNFNDESQWNYLEF